MKKTGVLLINLGTPSSASPRSVYRYLKEFLNDPRVIDLPALLRLPFVNGFLVPFRYKNSSLAYQKIWSDAGSPLLFHSEQFKKALASLLGPAYQLALGMRYGQPSIEAALKQLSDCHQIIVLPLFPQYSSAATGSAIEKAMKLLSKKWNIQQLHIIKDFYDDPGFIQAYVDRITRALTTEANHFILFSYHGLPERHLKKSDCLADCNRINPCPLVNEANHFCYRAHCFETTRLLVQHLNLTQNTYAVSFQSRLGRTPWIKPFTDKLLKKLIQKGIRNLAVVCPSFVADCLETLEEINIRARAQWQDLGGTSFVFIPALNQHPTWVNAVKNILINL